MSLSIGPVKRIDPDHGGPPRRRIHGRRAFLSAPTRSLNRTDRAACSSASANATRRGDGEWRRVGGASWQPGCSLPRCWPHPLRLLSALPWQLPARALQLPARRLLSQPFKVAQAPPALPAGQRGQRIDLPRADPQTQDVKIPVGAEPDGSAVSLDATVIAPAQAGSSPRVRWEQGRSRRPRPRAGIGGLRHAHLHRARVRRLGQADPSMARPRLRGRRRPHAPRPPRDPSRRAARRRRRPAGGRRRRLLRRGARAHARRARIRASTPSPPAITWHDLANALVPGRRGAQDGVFKRRWASCSSPPPSTRLRARPVGPINVCGRFDPTLCRVFLDAADTGTVSPTMEQILRRNSPAPLLSNVKAPTLLLQGMRDSLFGLDQSDATARALTAQGVPVALRWFDGGHDGGAAPRRGPPSSRGSSGISPTRGDPVGASRRCPRSPRRSRSPAVNATSLSRPRRR